MKKLTTILCHPSRIGIYFLDRWYTILGIWLSFFIISFSLFAVKDLAKPSFDNNYTNSFAEVIYTNDDLNELIYKDNKLEDINLKIETDYGVVYFNQAGILNTYAGQSMILVFGQEKASIYNGLVKLGEVSYNNLGINDFSLSKAKNGSVSDRLSFYSLVNNVIKSGDKSYRTLNLFYDVFQFIIFYFVAVLIAYFTGFVVNPLIERKIRFKLSCYDSMIYLVLSWISILYGVKWIGYVALIMPLIFAALTFSHIRKVKVRRNM